MRTKKLVKTLEDGTKIYRIQEKYIDNLGQEIEVDYLAHKKKQTHSSQKDPCGTMDECWNEEAQDWEP